MADLARKKLGMGRVSGDLFHGFGIASGGGGVREGGPQWATVWEYGECKEANDLD